MKSSLLTALAIFAAVDAEHTTTCRSHANTITFTVYQTFTQSGAYLIGADGRIVSTIGGSPTRRASGAATTISISTNAASINLGNTRRTSVTSIRPTSSTITPSASNGGVVGPILTDYTATATRSTVNNGISIDPRCTPIPMSTVVCSTRLTGVSSTLFPGCYLSTSTTYAVSCTLGPDGRPVYTQAPILLSTRTVPTSRSTRISTPSTFRTTSRLASISTTRRITVSTSSLRPTSLSTTQTLSTVQLPSTSLISTTRSAFTSTSRIVTSVLSSTTTRLSTLPSTSSSRPTVITSSTSLPTTDTPLISLTTTTRLPSTSPIASPAISISVTISTSPQPVVTDQAYIDTVLRHHNIHRLNHTVPNMIWNASLAVTAKKISETCIYAHNTEIDCTASGGCYGQNIAAGYAPTQMGFLISDGFYNSEEPLYRHYNMEPSLATVQAEIRAWGHFSQIVWLGSGSVGCYTNDCSAFANPATGSSGLGNIAVVTNIRPFFTVCNYYPPGNYIGSFRSNVLAPRVPALPSTHASYQCPTDANCADTATVPGSGITVNLDGSVGLPSVGVGVGLGVTLNRRELGRGRRVARAAEADTKEREVERNAFIVGERRV